MAAARPSCGTPGKARRAADHRTRGFNDCPCPGAGGVIDEVDRGVTPDLRPKRLRAG